MSPRSLRTSAAMAFVLALSSSCIAPSVVDPEQRAIDLGSDVEWSAASAADLDGTFISTELSGDLSYALRKLVYHFEPNGAYTGAALLDGAPPHFEVLSGSWRLDEQGLRLDEGPPATLEVAEDGSLRMSGDLGRVVLRREARR